MSAVEKKRQQAPVEEDDYSSGDDYDYSDFSDEEYSDDEEPQQQQQQQLQRRQQQQNDIDPNYKGMKTASPQSARKSMQPFERIGPPETSMDGPVTYARAQRGEIPMREGNPNQSLQTADNQNKQTSIDDEEGLKLKLELNLDVEVELKASIHGDLTLALLS
ncbi:hypothetical protein DTO212C5_1607 [Paecilomyces variotii]|nr:hypothetical protein DTO212C5_1607 [Paecilomyces variotii]KAJ9403832.1 hypothetical protein DTO045G8_8395 [Paecilomyces variotii]